MQFLVRSLSKSTRPLLNSRARQSWVLSQRCHSTFSGKKSSSRNHGGSITESLSPATWPRPAEIPYQPKIANCTDLIGYVNQHVEFHAKPDGSFWAGTVITHGPPSGSGSDPNSDSVHKFWLGFSKLFLIQTQNKPKPWNWIQMVLDSHMWNQDSSNIRRGFSSYCQLSLEEKRSGSYHGTDLCGC